jgi:arabinofuranosyltransferase
VIVPVTMSNPSALQKSDARPLRMMWSVNAALVVLIILASVLAFGLMAAQPVGIDDAYITFVYARHLQEGHGLVYNLGGERVEGATSMAWTLIASVVLAFTRHPEVPMLLVSGVLTFFTLRSALRVLQLVTGDFAGVQPRWLALLVVWAAAQPGLFAWNVLTLMESTLWTFLVTYAVSKLTESAWAATEEPSLAHHGGLIACVAAMALTRPESMLFLPLLLGCAVLAVARAAGVRAALRHCLPALVAFGLATSALVGFRVAYFGYPWPNTYYAKTDSHRLYSFLMGVRYGAKFLIYRPWNSAALSVLVVVFARVLRSVLRRAASREERALFVASGGVLCCLALPLLTGGDAFGEFRVYQPIVLLLIAPVAHLWATNPRVERLTERLRRGTRPIWAGLALTLLLSGVWITFDETHQLGGEFTAAVHGQRVGQSLSQALAGTAVPPTIGVLGAGGTAWRYHGPVVDLLGLNWTKMAHSNTDRRGFRHGHGAFSADIFWTQPPQILILDLQTGARCDARTRASSLQSHIVTLWLRGLTLSKRFERTFEAGCLGEGESSVVGFFSREWLRARPSAVHYHALIEG